MALLSSTRKTETLAPALPVNFEPFNKHRIVLRRGQFTIIAAAPNVGKSLFARNLVVNTPCPTIYYSADSDEYTVKKGVTASLTGQKLDLLDDHFEDKGWQEYYSNELRRVDHVDWCYNTDIDIDFIVRRFEAYSEIRGDYPHLVVVDNLGDMVTEDGDEYGELRAICRELRRIARTTKTHVFALHHTKGEWEDGQKPVTLKALLGNLGKNPENVFGLNWTDPSGTQVQMTIPKVRNGQRGTFPIAVDYTTARVGGFH